MSVNQDKDTLSVCGTCDEKYTDGAYCYACNSKVHFGCGGVSETSYRKLGAKKQGWRCNKCRQSGQIIQAAPSSDKSSAPVSSTPVQDQASMGAAAPQNAAQAEDISAIMLKEIRLLARKFEPLESLPQDVKLMRDEIKELKSSLSTVSNTLQEYANRIKKAEERLTQLENAKRDQSNTIQAQFDRLENENHEREQFSRSGNIELKGVPQSKNENLLDIVCAVGKKIQYPIAKTQLNFVTRVQSRDPNHVKPVIVSFVNRYVKEDFIAAARLATKISPLMSGDLGIEGKSSKIFVNDHLTVQNKGLLVKVKKTAKERGFQYVWVKFCKIFIRKDDTSPILNIKTEKDVSKIV